MKRVLSVGPGVVGNALLGVTGGPLAVGSAAWQHWLMTPSPDTRAFTFPDHAGTGLHRAYREWRRESPFWYVKVRIGPQIRRFYLGRPADIDGLRLATIAAAIATARAAYTSPL